VAGEGAGVGCCAGILLYRHNTVGLVELGVGRQMTVGIFIGDILSVRGHKEALEGQEVIGVRKPGAEEIIVVVGSVGLLGSKHDLTGGPEGVEGSTDADGTAQYMGVWGGVCLGVLAGNLCACVEDYAVDLVSFKSEADDDVASGPPAGGYEVNLVIGDKLGVVPGLAIIMRVIFPEDVAGGPIKDVNLSSIGGDGTGTIAVGGELRPLGIVGALVGVGDFLVVENIAGSHPDAVHGALAVEGDAVMVVGLGAFIEPRPGEPLDARLVVIDFGPDIGKAVGLLLGG